MHAIVRINTLDKARLAGAAAELQVFNKLHASQPGYRGAFNVDLGSGRRLVVNLWESEAHATAALEALVPEVERVLRPLMTGPSQLIGTGQVLDTDLALTR